MFRVLFLKRSSPNSEESFIDSTSYETLDKETAETIVKDAADWIVRRYNKGEHWTAEIVQVISRIERTGGSDGKEKVTQNP
jgi:hypothetical protein